jgi:hypothetical protein
MTTYKISIWPIPGADTSEACGWTGYFLDAVSRKQAVKEFKVKFPRWNKSKHSIHIWENRSLTPLYV